MAFRLGLDGGDRHRYWSRTRPTGVPCQQKKHAVRARLFANFRVPNTTRVDSIRLGWARPTETCIPFARRTYVRTPPATSSTQRERQLQKPIPIPQLKNLTKTKTYEPRRGQLHQLPQHTAPLPLPLPHVHPKGVALHIRGHLPPTKLKPIFTSSDRAAFACRRSRSRP